MNDDMKTQAETAKFNLWFAEKWKESGGLINQMTASRIIGCTDPYIRKLIKNNKLNTYEYEKSVFLSLNEVYNFKVAKEAKEKLKEN